MIDVYLNGSKIQLGNFLPITYGNANEDLYSLKKSQIRHYLGNIDTIKNRPNPDDLQWFSVVVIMQDNSSGMMFMWYDDGGIYVNYCAANKWQGWHKIVTQ